MDTFIKIYLSVVSFSILMLMFSALGVSVAGEIEIRDVALIIAAFGSAFAAGLSAYQAVRSNNKPEVKALHEVEMASRQAHSILISYGSDPELDSQQRKDFEKAFTIIEERVYLVPKPFTPQIKNTLKNCWTLINFSYHIENLKIAMGDGRKELNSKLMTLKVTWLNENRHIESEKYIKLANNIDKHLDKV